MTENTNISIISKVPGFHNVDEMSGYAVRGDETGQFQVASVLRDRRAGSVEYMKIFDKEVNVEHIARKLFDEGDREATAAALISRPFLPVFERLITFPTLKLDGAKLIKTDVIEVMNSVFSNGVVAEVLTEMVLPMLIEMGLVNPTNRFTARHTYGHRIPRLEDLRVDVVRQELEHLLSDARARVDLAPGRTYATRVVADEFNEAFFAVGKRLRQLGDYTAVLDDLVKGVRAYIDPGLTGLTGIVSNDFVNRTEVAILATNYNFIKAALEIKHGESINTTCDDWKLDKWVPVVFALIRNSDRYVMVGREEFCGAYQLDHINNLRGERRVAIFTEAAQIDPVSMTVIGEPSAELPGAWNLDEPSDKVGARLTAAYDRLPAQLSTLRTASMFGDVVRAIVETGLDDATYGVFINTLAIDDAEYVLDAYAALTSGRVAYNLDADLGPQYVFIARTTDKHYEPRCGYRDLDQVFTTSAVEAVLVADSKEASAVLSSRPQLIAPYALNTRLLGLGEDDLVPFNRPASFGFDVLGTSMRGRFDFCELVSMKNGRHMRIVRPWFNVTVAATSLMKLKDAYFLARQAASINEAVGTRLVRDIAAFIMATADSIGSALRQEVHDMMRARSVAKLPAAEAVALNARLKQDAFAGLADCYTLDLFLRRMGLTEDQTSTAYSDLLNDADFVAILAEYGSKRNK